MYWSMVPDFDWAMRGEVMRKEENVIRERIIQSFQAVIDRGILEVFFKIITSLSLIEAVQKGDLRLA